MVHLASDTNSVWPFLKVDILSWSASSYVGFIVKTPFLSLGVCINVHRTVSLLPYYGPRPADSVMQGFMSKNLY